MEMLLTHITLSQKNVAQSKVKDQGCAHIYHARNDTISGTVFHEYTPIRLLSHGMALRCCHTKCGAKIMWSRVWITVEDLS